jgi:hypothetical protein
MGLRNGRKMIQMMRLLLCLLTMKDLTVRLIQDLTILLIVPLERDQTLYILRRSCILMALLQIFSSIRFSLDS